MYLNIYLAADSTTHVSGKKFVLVLTFYCYKEQLNREKTNQHS